MKTPLRIRPRWNSEWRTIQGGELHTGGFTLPIFNHNFKIIPQICNAFSIDAFNSLESSIEEAMTWSPKILFPSSQLKISGNNTVILNYFHDSTNKSSDVDIVHLQSLSTKTNIIDKLSSELQYPKGALFQFEGYKGLAHMLQLLKNMVHPH
jgi:hypothetical protein